MAFLELKIPPPLVVLACVCGLYFSKNWFPSFGFPSNMRWFFAGCMVCCCVVLVLLAALKFRQAKTTVNPTKPEKSTAIVCTGIYAVTRNPMYLAMVIFVAGAGIALQHTGAIIFVLLCMLYLQRFQILPEERGLQAKFGEPYAHYCKKVPRWF